MTKSACRSEINRNNQLISQYQAEIAVKENEIAELTTSQGKLQEAAGTFSGCRSVANMGLAGFSVLSRINDRFLDRFHEGMSDLLGGSRCSSVVQGLENAVTQTVNEIQKKNNEIIQLKNNITNCQNTIQSMQAEIARIEAEEARARARAEAEARARAEAEARARAEAEARASASRRR